MLPSKTRPRGKMGATKSRARKSPAVGTSGVGINQAEPDQQSPQPVASSSALREFFQELFRGVIPASPLHQVAQEAARLEGWTAPWEHEDQTPKRKKAGQASGHARWGRAELRRSILKVARARLTPDQRLEPYANNSIDALCKEYRGILEGKDHLGPPRSPYDGLLPFMLAGLPEADSRMLKKASRETLLKDLKQFRRESGVGRQ
jgi:hypothetical protein